MPTLLSLLESPPPPDRILDGIDVGPHVFDGAPADDRLLYYYGIMQGGSGGGLDAVRDARFNTIVDVASAPRNRTLLRQRGPGPLAFDLDRDPNDSRDVSTRYPEAMARMAAPRGRVREDERNPRGWVD